MGQYYKAIILGEKDVKEFVRAWLESYRYNNGAKLTEHSYINNEYVAAVERLLSREGMFYKSRLVWAGDYAEPDPGCKENLHHLASEDHLIAPPSVDTTRYRFIVNHTKKQYVDKKGLSELHPLPLLTAEGNGRGGGDYHGRNQEQVGLWARDVISMEQEKPEGFEQLVCDFTE
jgi:hypothetical protein